MSDYYLGIKPCGCAVATISADPELKADAAREVARWIRKGWRVETRPVEEVRKLIRRCDCEAKAKAAAWSSGR